MVDLDRDRRHPWKRSRPIAAGRISVPVALATTLLLLLLALGIAASINQSFLIICLAYVGLQIGYSIKLKQIVLLDIFALAAGYILRVYAGEFATGWHISVWLLLAVISLSLFLAVGKRRAELTSLQSAKLGKTRTTLTAYPEKLLDVYFAMFANATWLTYAFFTFFEHSTVGLKPTLTSVFVNIFPWGLERKWMMITIPIVMYGIMRYMQIAYTRQEGEAPERVFLSDHPLLFTVLLWTAMVVIIIYGIGA